MLPGSPSMTGGGQRLPGRLELADQPVEVLLPVLGALAVARLLVVAGAAREVGRQRVLGAGDRPVADAVAVDVFVALELPEALQVFGVQRPCRARWAWSGYGNGSVSQRFIPRSRSVAMKTGRLELLRQVEGLDGQRVAFLDRAGDQDDVAGVAVAQEVELEDVALAGAGGQAGARPHALNVDDHDGDLGEVGHADELGHQRDARPGGRRQRPGAGPARADGHADGRQLVFGLDDGEGPLAVGRRRGAS